MKKRKLYQMLATLAQSRINCIESKNIEWRDRHTERMHKLAKLFLPSGSGFDSGSSVRVVECTGEKLVLATAFHHMNNDGYYTGWTHHNVVVTPSLSSDFIVKITGRDKNNIKDYIGEVFHTALGEEIDEDKFYADEALRMRVA